ncbi:membrane associated DnaJ chaperone-like protein [Tricladium varicosporioides]|nr:membrane associated DnaJ chaperone-like protein [Hymenoscyphus varicosporioides]
MSANNLLSMAGWMFLPNLATGWLQSIWYGVTIRAGDPKPQPGSPKFNMHKRRIYISVVSIYLLYTIYEADWDIRRASDFYQDLNVSLNATDRDIKSRFRRLAATYHPDKVSSTSASEGYFVHLKLAQDTLLNPAKRFAYERFGPSMLEWQRCSSVKDYVMTGLWNVIPYYGAAAVVMYIMGFLGYLEWGKYWRWITLIIMCVFECHTISRPYFPYAATKFLNPILTTISNHPPILPFQLIELARKASITMFIAFSQIGPMLSPPTVAIGTDGTDAQLARLEASAKAADAQASALISIDMSPFVNDPVALKEMKGQVKEWLVQNTIRNDPEVRDAMGNVLKRRRVDAPAGAKGTR